MTDYRLYYLDKYSCGLKRIPFKQKLHYYLLEGIEDDLEKLKTNPRFINFIKREQVILCHKDDRGWRIVKILDKPE